MNRSDLAAAIVSASHLTGEFKLRSGQISNFYFDKYQFESRPDLLQAIGEQMVPLIPPGTEVLAGLELGGVPVATVLSLRTGIPACFVRKTAKEYGTAKLAEGADVKGKKVLMIEDIVTTGGQLILSLADLRALGAEITTALCVIDREAGGGEILKAQGVELLPLFRKGDLPTK
jgi:orotate phosphoribosyltransferase